MKYILDTHIIIWFFEGSERLSKKAKEKILNKEIEKYVSIASIWEVAIKLGKNKLPFDGGLSQLCKLIEYNGFKILQINQKHLEKIIGLENVHKDPFDRLLIATAKAENMTIITADANIQRYNDVSWIF